MTRILLVEDNPGDARLIEEMLREEIGAGPFETTVSETLSDCLERLSTSAGFDLVLLDLGLPDSSGLETLDSVIRKEPRVPVVVITGLQSIETGVAALARGAQDYLVKGRADGNLLVRTIRHAIERKRAIDSVTRERDLNELQIKIMSSIASIPPSEIDAYMSDLLRSIAEFLKVDHILLIRFSEDLSTWKVAHEWCGPNVQREARDATQISKTLLSVKQQVQAGNVIRIDSRGGTPEGMAKASESGESFDDHALLGVPIHAALGRASCSLELHSHAHGKTWSDVDVDHARILGNVTAISLDRRRASIQLRQSEDLFRAAFENATVGVALIGTDGRFLRVNRTLCNLLGYPKEELEQMRFNDVTHDEDKELGSSAVSELLAKKRDTTSYEKRYVRKDGQAIWAFVSTTIVRSPEAEKSFFVTHIFDITARKAAEESIRESEERFRALFDRSFEGLYIHDLNGRFLDANPAILNIMGYSKEEIRGMSFASLLDEKQIQQAMDTLREIAVTGTQRESSIWKLRKKDGGEAWVETKASLVLRDNKPYAVLGLVHDITNRLRYEAELLRSKEAAEGATLKAQTYLDFIAHDLTNILSPVMMYAEMISADSRSDPWVRKTSAKIAKQIEHAASFVRNSRRLAESEKNESKRREVVDLRSLLDDAEESTRMKYPMRRFTFERSIQLDGPVLAEGKEFIMDIFEELLDNSAKHCIADDIQVDIAILPVDSSGGRGYWRIEVADHGPGIPDAMKKGLVAEVFDQSNRFRRGIASSLPFMALVAEHIGGRLRIEDRVPGDHTMGAKIILLVQRAPADEAKSASDGQELMRNE